MLDQDLGVLDVPALMRRAANGDPQAWERLIDQYARLIWSITVDYKLVESDAADVAQTTWLRLLEHIDRIEYPDRVGSWLAATARNECLRCLASHKRVVPSQDDVELNGAVPHVPEIDERLLADERARVVREALSRLPWRWRRLLELLMADPPVSYADISDELGLPIGSIGPTRARSPSPAARPATSFLSQMSERPPTGRLRSRLPDRHPGLRPAGPERTAAPHPACPRPAGRGRPPGCRFPASAGPAWRARHRSPRAGADDPLARGTTVRPPLMRRHSRAPYARRTVPPPASHAEP